MRETRDLEYKEAITSSYLKTVSAYANYGTGIIQFGIADDGTVKGIPDPQTACLNIENTINDSIDPVPDYALSIDEATNVITLTVKEGLHKPYLYRSKAYRRNDSATIEADRLELTRLILEGQNMSYEELPAVQQQLSFDILREKLTQALHLETVTRDTLKTLELYSDKNGYNIAAELLADSNPHCGIDMVRFGSSISVLRDRETYEHISILSLYDHALTMYRKYYQYETIEGSERRTIETIPEKAFREAVANALVHRAWDIKAAVNIAMFDDRIEITSPSGLPKGITESEYLQGGISLLRNRIIGNVFFRLGLIERFGTGIRRINETYTLSSRKPLYTLTQESIRITLPVIDTIASLSKDEQKLYRIISTAGSSSSEIAEKAGFGKSKTISILRSLLSRGYIKSFGNGRGTRYSR